MSHIKPLMKGFSKTTGFWPLIFVTALVIVGNTAISSAEGDHIFLALKNRQILTEGAAAWDAGAVVGSASPFFAINAPSTPPAVLLIADASSLMGRNQAVTKPLARRAGVAYYSAKKGDTLSGIAAKYGITLGTLTAANPKAKDPLKRGQTLVILPVSGTLYTVAPGDTLASIAGRFNVNPREIERYNSNYGALLRPSHQVVVPSGE